MFLRTKEHVRNARNSSIKLVEDRIQQLRLQASHLLVKTIWRHLRKTCRPCRRLWTFTTTTFEQAQRWANTMWDKHCQQVATNAAYATALAAAVTTVVELIVHDPAALAILAAVVAVYLAVHHANSTSPYRPAPSKWSDGIDWR